MSLHLLDRGAVRVPENPFHRDRAHLQSVMDRISSGNTVVYSFGHPLRSWFISAVNQVQNVVPGNDSQEIFVPNHRKPSDLFLGHLLRRPYQGLVGLYGVDLV